MINEWIKTNEGQPLYRHYKEGKLKEPILTKLDNSKEKNNKNMLNFIILNFIIKQLQNAHNFIKSAKTKKKNKKKWWKSIIKQMAAVGTSYSQTSASPDPKFDLSRKIRHLEVVIVDHNTHHWPSFL